MRVLFCGSDSFSSTILNRLIQGNRTLKIFSLIPASSQTGRGLKKVYRPPLLDLVEELNIPHHSLPRPDNRERNPLKHWSIPDEFIRPEDDEPAPILLSASFPYRIPRETIGRFSHLRALNVHPSLLPRYRGAAPIQWQLAEREPELGVSIQELSPAGFDTGSILAQKPISLPPKTCYPAAETALADLAADMLHQLIPNIDSYIASAWPQDPSKVSYAPKITPLDLRIDPSWSYAKVAGRFRGMGHQHPLSIQLNGEPYQIQVELPDTLVSADFAVQNAARLALTSPGDLLFDRKLDRIALRLGPDPSAPPLLICAAKLLRAGGKGWLGPAAWWDRLFNTAPSVPGSPRSLKTFKVALDPPSS
ncbi:Methionyl-tRNA formyltransferase [Puccinia graminis f. sp. tritici]|uniref:Methionyl-tRNA formyltransferase n=1 Tax=Puccinia graminis f. sp. tritici TaxID=56615 RepID=A0A5B0PL12_PUCGR|nr:Methionyl-tRNA formyltransferase [Puccinia graminis f. sp. tritici]